MTTFRGLILLLALSLPLKAQDYTHVILRVNRVELVSHHPDMNPFAMASDKIWFDGTSIKAPRVVFHLGYSLLNDGIDHTLGHFNVPGRQYIVRYGLPLTPHLIQAYQGLRGKSVYQLNFYDWIYDFNDKQPIHFNKSSMIGHAINSTLFSAFARP